MPDCVIAGARAIVWLVVRNWKLFSVSVVWRLVPQLSALISSHRRLSPLLVPRADKVVCSFVFYSEAIVRGNSFCQYYWTVFDWFLKVISYFFGLRLPSSVTGFFKKKRITRSDQSEQTRFYQPIRSEDKTSLTCVALFSRALHIFPRLAPVRFPALSTGCMFPFA